MPENPQRIYTAITRSWLETRYVETGDGGGYRAHEPVWGLAQGPTEPGHARRMMRVYDLLEVVRALGLKSLVDVGGSEGYFAWHCHELLGVEAASVDLSIEACNRAAQLFSLPTCAVNAAALPFDDDAFDAVVMAEVVEHLTDPIGAILEARRVAKRAVIISTEEWSDDAATRDHILGARNLKSHGEKNIYCAEDIRPLFGDLTVYLESQRFPDAFPDLDDDAVTADAVVPVLLGEKDDAMHRAGIIIVAALDPELSSPFPADRDAGLARAVATSSIDVLAPLRPTGSVAHPRVDLRCPQCGHRKTDLAAAPCPTCGFAAHDDRGALDFFCEHEFDARRASLLDELGTDYPEQAQDLARLDQAFRLTFDDRESWTGEQLNDEHGWQVHNAEATAAGVWRSSNFDPQLVSPWLGIPLVELEGIEFDLRIEGGAEIPADHRFCEVFFWLDGRYHFQADEVFQMRIEATDQVQRCFAPFPDDLRKSASYMVSFRIDPVCLSGITFACSHVKLRKR